MGSPQQPPDTETPVWEPEPLELPLEHPETRTQEGQEQESEGSDDVVGSHVIVVDLA